MELDVSKKYAPAHLGRVLVLGLGTSGSAVSRYLVAQPEGRVSSLFVAAGAPSKDAAVVADELNAAGAEVHFDVYEFEGHYDLCIASPGISERSDFYRSAVEHASEIVSEVEFAWRESSVDSRWVAITGTNGKTTTTALAAHILASSGLKARAVGNIGDTCIDAVASDDVRFYVAEVSSYQLASTRRFKPDVAVLLNITPDHLKWHGSLEAYAQAKQKVYANCDSSCTVIMDATCDVVRAFVREERSRGAFTLVPLGTKDGLSSSMIETCGAPNAAYLDGAGHLTVEVAGVRHTLVKADELLIKGAHNASNALAAASVAVALGVSDEAICSALKDFHSLEHRIEPCGTVMGVSCYNDSKGTNVDATLKALAAFSPEHPIVLLGGDDKGTELSELVAQAGRHCKAVVLFGASRPRFEEAFTHAVDSLIVLTADHMADAFEVGLGAAQPGDILVLSPACASFDEFSCFEERGDVFKQLVERSRSQKGA